MKILYAVQATGNGHIARAIEMMPHLQKYGEVDVFLSGSNSSLNPNLPVKYRSSGLSLFYRSTGSLDYKKIISRINLSKIQKEAKELPVSKYDLILNDFEFICAKACKIANKKMIHIGHQASFVSKNAPRPDKSDVVAEWVLKNYCKGNKNIGFHYEAYENWILPPVIKQSLWNAAPTNKGHVAVYLPQYSDMNLYRAFSSQPKIQFEVFSKHIQTKKTEQNITWMPIDNENFANSLIHCHGIITGAGFETPAESLFLGKKMLLVPIKGQYEQLCNAESLKKYGAQIEYDIDHYFGSKINEWYYQNPSALDMEMPNFLPTNLIIEKAMEIALA
jgi:uncharacterized protein (TIGR00661 family)